MPVPQLRHLDHVRHRRSDNRRATPVVMPYSLRKRGGGYVVVTKATGRTHSKKPLSRARAMAQMRALYANEKGL